MIDQRVVNIDELEARAFHEGRQVRVATRRASGRTLGAKDLGYSYDVVPPGKSACPFHSHRAEEEMFFIVKGNGTLRYGDETRKIRAGDVICCPTGGPGNGAPDRQRFERGSRVHLDQHHDAGGGLRVPGFEEDRRVRRQDAEPPQAHDRR